MSVLDEGYSRNTWCGNNWIYTFVHVVTRVYFLLAGKCKPDCKHGGVCIGNNKCQCPAAYSGEICKFSLIGRFKEIYKYVIK